ncbi:MAG: hypothetical protein H6621_09640 [Halobacteriovoraceae bacterium]|nr:hypothetical protein [Halobacteriovoraceae bacterium]MCB9095319.1 hypothetical protein [Halobacteriovoraceae bacterium]
MLLRLFFFAITMNAALSWAAGCPEANLPSSTRYDEKTLTFMTTVLRVKDRNNDNEKVAEIRRRRFNLPKTLIQEGYIAGTRFDYNVSQGNTSWYGSEKYDNLSFYGEQVFKKLEDALLNRIEVKDCQNKTIGFVIETIRYKAAQVGAEILEKIIEIATSDENGRGGLRINLSNMYSEFEIYDANMKLLGKSESFKFLNDNFTISSNDNMPIFEMTMKGFNFDPGADWYLDFDDNKSEIDNRILALIPAFKTYRDAIEDFADSLE